ncbi:MAG TPA: glycogen debranching N-terminal domain-containing protein [Naasia sp.]
MTGIEGLQPLLADAVITLAAPSQAWSASNGDMVAGTGIAGFYDGDRRILSALSVAVADTAVEPIAASTPSAGTAEFVALLRGLDDSGADPRLRLVRTRSVTPGRLEETLTLQSALAEPVDAVVTIGVATDLAAMHDVKAGIAGRVAAPVIAQDGEALVWSDDTTTARLVAPGAQLHISGAGAAEAVWRAAVPAHGTATLSVTVEVEAAGAVVLPPATPSPWTSLRLEAGDVRLQRWVSAAVGDLGALRMSTSTRPDAVFLAAGAPWFFTLFGRDSLWAARMLLPLGTDLARDTLRILADVQGRTSDPDTAEQPGKILHELRAEPLEIPAEGLVLPPLYYGTVDATALWICLLREAWEWGMADADVEALLPALESALAWLRDYGDSDGDGFLEYVDESGRGLANQGWKDSGDSIQWSDGHLADGPIALCEVQGYAYQAARGGADLLDGFGRPGGEEWRAWADRLKERFGPSFWVGDEDTGYPAVALDASKRPVDSLTSNIGHLLGTGILTPGQAAAVARHLSSDRLDSGYGLRTMSTDDAGYWPLSYHGGSVWAHDTGIAVLGLAREGFGEEATALMQGLLRAAEGFGYRMPELHSGDPATLTSAPIPYPAACRPQAWSAAAAIAVLSAALGLTPDRGARSVAAAPLPIALRQGVSVEGVRYGGRAFLVTTGGAGAAVTAVH